MFSRESLRIKSFCRICCQYHRHQHAICQACIELFDPLGPACRFCAIPLPSQPPLICGTCSMKPPLLDQVFIAYRFSEPLRTLVHAFKYEGALYLTSLLTQLLLEAGKHAELPQCFIPVPMHIKRLQNRGFNQAALLASTVSKKLQRPCLLEGCLKVTPTQPQAELNAQERQTNLINAFQAPALPFHHITLIDDLFTTGATANTVAQVLKQQGGVKRVDIWCCARTC